MSLKLNVYSPERKLLEGLEVDRVTLTGSEGQIQVLSGHANMVGTLESGEFGYLTSPTSGQEEYQGFISTGFFEVFNDEISVTGETLELADEIDVSRASQAETKALEKLKDPSLTLDEIEKYSRKVQRARARQDVQKRFIKK